MPAALAPSLPSIQPETPFDASAVDALVLVAFGPGRFAKTAERLREDSRPAAGFVAREGGRVIGSVRLWPIRVGETEALFLGPIAVAAEARKGGVGARLVEACLSHAREIGAAGVLLVGDPPFFARFGFRGAADVRLPGPVEPGRVMWLPLNESAPAGLVRRD